MAGRVRQPIDVAALEKYISQNVPVIKTPIDVKQVSIIVSIPLSRLIAPSSALASPTQHINSHPQIRSAMC